MVTLMYPIFKIAYYCLNQDTLREVKSQKSKVKILHLSESGGYRATCTELVEVSRDNV